MPPIRPMLALRHTLRHQSTQARQPPPAGVYKTAPPKNPVEVSKPADTAPEPPAKAPRQPPDLARGYEAARRVVTEGKLDPRYRGAAWRVTAIIASLPVAIYCTYVLYQRYFLGVEPKVRENRPLAGEEKMGLLGSREEQRDTEQEKLT